MLRTQLRNLTIRLREYNNMKVSEYNTPLRNLTIRLREYNNMKVSECLQLCCGPS